jgi:hypothetical protein
MPEGSGEGVVMVTDCAAIVSVRVSTAELPAESVTFTVNVYEPAVVEVPERVPVELSAMPGGSDPPTRVHV